MSLCLQLMCAAHMSHAQSCTASAVRIAPCPKHFSMLFFSSRPILPLFKWCPVRDLQMHLTPDIECGGVLCCTACLTFHTKD